MIISRTPFRISLFGGGTDYPQWYRTYGGAALVAAIDKYCYISVRHLPPFFDYRHRIVYSQVEMVKEVAEIRHPAIRGVMQERGISTGLEIHHDADLPARSGLGSSSSFVVGLLNALAALEGKMMQKSELASEAIRIEQQVLRETVGCQDQIAAAWGGLNHIEFRRDGGYDLKPMVMPAERAALLQDSMMLCFTGLTRIASQVAQRTIDNMKARERELMRMRQMVAEAAEVLGSSPRPIEDLGGLMREAWTLKRELAENVSTPEIDEIHQAAMAAGASGGKLMGAGGGGFMVFLVRPELQAKVRERLKRLVHVRVRFDREGSRIIVYEPDRSGA